MFHLNHLTHRDNSLPFAPFDDPFLKNNPATGYCPSSLRENHPAGFLRKFDPVPEGHPKIAQAFKRFQTWERVEMRTLSPEGTAESVRLFGLHKN